MAKPPTGTTPEQQAAAFSIPKMQRHILLCAGPDCTDPATGEAAWAYVKMRVAQLKLHQEPHFVFRTKCHCLRICTAGPILVVQPDNTWYKAATPEIIERILQEHVIGGQPVTEYVIASNPLPPVPPAPPASHK